MKANPITATFPFDQNGIHHGHLRLSCSRNLMAAVEPVYFHSLRHGILAGRHFQGLVKSADCMAVVAVETDCLH